MPWINLNDTVRFKPTKFGLEMCDQHLAACLFEGRTVTPLILDDDGRATMTLWEFMRVFGPHFYNGCELPVVTADIEILETRG